ncbi:hypothetical protein LCGC14_2926890 [marine sediment metagenome]|uniref:RNA-binding protein KhpB N-terminal domain-containing protein n=1 Tax=marine sediment metagenome TaxID=412755 RepID=A0A0F8Y8X5_9ZZZZ
MESVEVGAKSVDEAIDEALEELGLKRQQVEIEILTAGKPGLFGIGGEQAREPRYHGGPRRVEACRRVPLFRAENPCHVFIVCLCVSRHRSLPLP